MKDVISHARSGRLVLGICNGAQICAESGLVPGTFTTNEYPKFICDRVYLKVENNSSPFTSLYEKGEVISMPIAHKEGRYVAPDDIVDKLERENRVAFKFCNEKGETGVLSENVNVLAMMPHPERAAEKVLGSDDGKRIFDSMIAHIEAQ